MKKIAIALAAFFLCSIPAFSQSCTPGGGITCTPNLNLYQPPHAYPNWDAIINSNYSIIDAAVGALQSQYQGIWSSAATYSKGQIVTYLGSTYESLTNSNINNVPSATSSQWTVIPLSVDPTQINWPHASGSGPPTTFCPTSATGTLVSGSRSITVSTTVGIFSGQVVSGTGVPTGSTVVSVNTLTSTVVISANATASGSGVSLSFNAYGMPYTDTTNNNYYVCEGSGWTKVNGSTTSGVTQITGPSSTVTGPVNFGGPGVTQTGNTFTFPSSSGGPPSVVFLAPPVQPPGTITATPSTTGGTLAANTYFITVTSTNGTGETIPSAEVSKTTTGSTGSIATSWAAVTGATGYKVYIGTSSGAEGQFFTTATNSFTITTATGTSGTPPLQNTTVDMGSEFDTAVLTLESNIPAGGEIKFPAGSSNIATTATDNSRLISVSGSGPIASRVTCTVAGSCLTIHPDFFGGLPSGLAIGGTIHDFSLIGNGASNQILLHHIDTIGWLEYNLVLDGSSSSAASVCDEYENFAFWNERNVIPTLQTGYNCTVGLEFLQDGGDSSNSFGYNYFYGLHQSPGTGQIGIYVNGSASSSLFYGGQLTATENVRGGTVFKAVNANINPNEFENVNINAEANSSGTMWNVSGGNLLLTGYANLGGISQGTAFNQNFFILNAFGAIGTQTGFNTGLANDIDYGSAAGIQPRTFMCPNMTAGQICQSAWGLDQTTNGDQATFGFQFQAIGSSLNRGFLGMGGIEDLTWDKLGNVYLLNLPSQSVLGTDANGKFIAGSAASVSVNGAAIPNPNFNGTAPSAPIGAVNTTYQSSSSNASNYVPPATGSTPGVIRPDGTTCTVGTGASAGVLTCTGSSGATSIAICSDTSGSGTAQSCTTSPSFTPVAGSVIAYTTSTPNSGTSLTENVNASGAKPVAKWQNQTTLAANDMRAGTYVLETYDGTNWEMGTIGNAPSGGGGAFTQIAQTIVSGSTTSSVTFSSISGSYSQLKLVMMGASSSASDDTWNVYFNGDNASTNYDEQEMYNSVGGSGTPSSFGATAVATTFSATLASNSSGRASSATCELPSYSATTFFKTMTCESTSWKTGGFLKVETQTADWKNTAAITSVTVACNNSSCHLMPGTTVTLYGEQ